MGEETGISWTEATWNPFLGCTKVSTGCKFCYMFREQRQYGNDPEVVRRSKTRFRDPIKWPKPTLIFTCSWSDWFHEAADEWRPEAWEVIRDTPRHTYQILTKRPEMIADRLPADWGAGYPNVWLGVSIENSRFTWRADELRKIPAALRFISAEPLLGSLFEEPPAAGRELSRTGIRAKGTNSGRGYAGYGDLRVETRKPLELAGIDWVIVGGESGSRKEARPMHPEWAREIREAIMGPGPDLDPNWKHHVPGPARSPRPAFHFKQWGSYGPDPNGNDINGVWVGLDGRKHTSMLADAYDLDLTGAMRMRYAGPAPKSGGKHLDGVEWCEIPVWNQADAA